MPTYEYRCRSCGHTFDVVQPMSDESLSVCPVCGGELRKVFAPPAISFKGSGFYATDHGKKSKTSADKTGEATGEKPAASADGKSEKKDKKESSKEPAKPAEKTPASSSASSGAGGSGSTGSSSDGKKGS